MIIGKDAKIVGDDNLLNGTDRVVDCINQIAEDYLLNREEAEKIIDSLEDKLSGGILKDMYASGDRKQFARKLMIEDVEKQVKKRKPISIPSNQEMVASLKEVLEEVSDEMAFQLS